MKRTLVISFSFILVSTLGEGQSFGGSESVPKSDYQIHLKQPAKEIKLLMYENNFLPLQGKLSEDKKSVIMKNYEMGTKIRVRVIYEDGTVDEFVKTPCFIDPVVL